MVVRHLNRDLKKVRKKIFIFFGAQEMKIPDRGNSKLEVPEANNAFLRKRKKSRKSTVDEGSCMRVRV